MPPAFATRSGPVQPTCPGGSGIRYPVGRVRRCVVRQSPRRPDSGSDSMHRPGWGWTIPQSQVESRISRYRLNVAPHSQDQNLQYFQSSGDLDFLMHVM